MSEEEYLVFLEEFKDDLLSINEVNAMNNQLAKKQPVDLSGQQIFDNPYNVNKVKL